MSNLLNTEEGRAALYEARNFLLRRRISRFFKRNLVIDYDRYSSGSQEFDLETLLGDLNPAHDDEIRDLYRLLGSIGGLENSLSDLNIYVDATLGNDQTGTGSTDRPFASLWFVPYLPKNINHLYRIILMTDIDMSGNEGSYLDFNQNIGIEGCLTIAGYSAPEHVLQGLDATITTNTPFLSSEYLGLNPPPTLATIGTFLQNTTVGAREGEAKPPIYYTTVVNGELLTTAGVTCLVNDTVQYIQPALTLSCRGLNIRVKMAEDEQDTNENIGARFGILNLNIVVEQGVVTNRGSVFVDCEGSLCMSFCRISPDPGASPGSSLQLMEWRKGNLNYQNLQDINVYNEIGLGTMPNIKNRSGAFDCVGLIVDNGSGTNNILTFVGKYWNSINNCFAIGKLRLIGAAVYLNLCAAYNGFYMSFSEAQLYNSPVVGQAGNAIDLFNSHLRIAEVPIQQAIQAISLQNSILHASGIGIEATYGRVGGLPSYHAQLSAASTMIQIDAWNGMASATADVRLIDSNPDITGAWPGAGAQLTDALQSAVVRTG